MTPEVGEFYWIYSSHYGICRVKVEQVTSWGGTYARVLACTYGELPKHILSFNQSAFKLRYKTALKIAKKDLANTIEDAKTRIEWSGKHLQKAEAILATIDKVLMI
jgi:hypothetical protein